MKIVIKAATGEAYFGQNAAAQYGDMISKKYKGETISRDKRISHRPGGIAYEADALGMNTWKLVETLEGMRHDGRATEIDDTTYKILSSEDITTGYYYILKHGLGPGTLPKDVEVIDVEDLPRGLTAVHLDRFLTTSELDKYDIYPETHKIYLDFPDVAE